MFVKGSVCPVTEVSLRNVITAEDLFFNLRSRAKL